MWTTYKVGGGEERKKVLWVLGLSTYLLETFSFVSHFICPNIICSNRVLIREVGRGDV